MKRLLSALLTTAMLLSLCVAPISASGSSSFADVTDSKTAVNADVLRLMGVVDGTGSNQFNPNGTLTRAEFCVMVVKFMQLGDQVPMYATRTIFSDVTAKHWGLGYVNLAASTTVADGESRVALISGVGNGKFQPEDKITLAQAATILIRVLGYSSKDAGAVWPESYMNLAKSISLTDQISAGYNSVLTRAQAAQLFVNALGCKTSGGALYCSKLGDASEDTVVLAVGVTSEDTSKNGAVRTSQGTYITRDERIKPTALQGLRGTLVVNDKNEIVTFLPDESVATVITLSGGAQPSYLKGTNGIQYAISGATPVYTADKTDAEDYISAHTALYSGNEVTMFSERGKIVAIYVAGGSTAIDDGAVVVSGAPSAATFYTITGKADNVKVKKNRQIINLGDIQPNDVVTYDRLSNTLIVSDLRVSCVIENATPTIKAPESIEAMGTKFPVLESAWNFSDTLRTGDQAVLLLTADGQVAAIKKPDAKLRSNAMGMVKDGRAVLFLPNGAQLALGATVRDAETLENRLVTLNSSKAGEINASNAALSSASGAFNVSTMRLGNYTVAAGVRLFEQVKSGSVVAIATGDIEQMQIAQDKVAGYRLNSSGMVDYLVLKDTTGNAYQYGMMAQESKIIDDHETYVWKLVNHAPLALYDYAGFSGKKNEFYGVALNEKKEIIGDITLKAIKNVKASAFYEKDGTYYVDAGGTTYRVAEAVECYRKVDSSKQSERNWYAQSTGYARLNACKMEGGSFTLYLDPIGNMVRIVSAD